MKQIIVESRRKKEATLQKKYSQFIAIDVTSKGEYPWNMFSPFYPHGNIPVPNSATVSSMSVEGIWQGLKVFEKQGIDISSFQNNKMKDLKRTVRKYGQPLGHQYGTDDSQLLGYIEARRKIFLPAYQYILDNYLSQEVAQLKEIAATKTILLLDYETNCDIDNPKKPLSHAFLLKSYLEGTYQELYKEKKTEEIDNGQMTMF